MVTHAKDVYLDSRTLLSLAVEADADPRSVAKELRALRGDAPHVRGRAGERIRAVLASRGLVPRRDAA